MKCPLAGHDSHHGSSGYTALLQGLAPHRRSRQLPQTAPPPSSNRIIMLVGQNTLNCSGPARLLNLAMSVDSTLPIYARRQSHSIIRPSDSLNFSPSSHFTLTAVYSRMAALIKACASGQLQLAADLLDQGQSIHATDSTGVCSTQCSAHICLVDGENGSMEMLLRLITSIH